MSIYHAATLLRVVIQPEYQVCSMLWRVDVPVYLGFFVVSNVTALRSTHPPDYPDSIVL
jgi:hypothetical protein